MSAFSDITAGLVTALSGLAGGRVYRGFAWSMPEDITSMIFVRPEASSSDRAGLGGGPVDWKTSFAVEIRVRYTPDTQSPDQAVDSLLADTYAALAGYSASGVMDVVPGTQVRWDYSEAEVNIAGATLFLDVVHRTQSSTLTAWT